MSAMIEAVSYSYSFFLFSLLIERHPHGGTAVHDPPEHKHDQAIDQRSEMIPVGKESDSLGPIGELEETKRTSLPLGDLDQTL